ncbi:hypothetical protein [Halanaerocella petrolearia]
MLEGEIEAAKEEGTRRKVVKGILNHKTLTIEGWFNGDYESVLQALLVPL